MSESNFLSIAPGAEVMVGQRRYRITRSLDLYSVLAEDVEIQAPTRQFRPDGRPVDHLAEILSVLRDFGPFQREPDGPRRTTGWGEVEWFLSPHVLLDGATPATMLALSPGRVFRAARVEFEIDAR